MATGLMDRQTTKPSSGSEPSVKEIIARGRSRQQPADNRPGGVATWLLTGLTGLMVWASFTPVNASPLAWIALVPILLLIRLPQPTKRMYSALYVTALISQLAMLQWMRLGDPTMYIAMSALALYLACYLPVFVAVGRFAVHRWGVPLVVTVPVLWIGTEYAKAYCFTGFSWYYLGHTQYRWLELIQISDLVGAYGVSFVVAMANAAVAGLIPLQWLQRLRLVTPEATLLASAIPFRSALIPVATTAVLFGAVWGYGMVRRHQADFQPGPRVALIQGNFTASLRNPQPEQDEVYLAHLRLTARAVREQPDLIVWPEGMYPYIILDAAPGMTDDQLTELTPQYEPKIWTEHLIRNELAKESQKTGAALLWGAHSARAEPDGIRQMNSAVFVTPDQGFVGHYDKQHLVPFGEYIPLKGVLPWLQGMTPYRGDMGLHAGEHPVAFNYQKWRFAPVICFEDTVPHLVRDAVARGHQTNPDRKVDVLVNLTNDGWFHGSSELDQHLITAAFRAVECRTPLVRAVNTGISAIVDGDGAILEPEIFLDGDRRRNSDEPPRTSSRDPKTGKWYRQLSAALIHTVPLDNRRSWYVMWGDWFAGSCAACAAVALVMSLRERWRKKG